MNDEHNNFRRNVDRLDKWITTKVRSECGETRNERRMIAYYWLMNRLLDRSRRRPYPRVLADFASEILAQFPGSEALDPSPLVRGTLLCKALKNADRNDLVLFHPKSMMVAGYLWEHGRIRSEQGIKAANWYMMRELRLERRDLKEGLRDE